MKSNSVGIELLTELVGQEKAVAFIQHFGGREYKFPQSEQGKQAQRLKQILGEETALTLIRHFCGDKPYIKTEKAYFDDLRNKKFLNEFYETLDSGLSKTLTLWILCPKYGFTKRWGDEIVSRHERSQSLSDKNMSKNLADNAKKIV